jgi:osmotically-inducible protein OsmY
MSSRAAGRHICGDREDADSRGTPDTLRHRSPSATSLRTAERTRTRLLRVILRAQFREVVMTEHVPRTDPTRGYFPRYSPDSMMFDNGVVAEPAGATNQPLHHTVVRTDNELTRAATQALGEEPGVPRGITLRVANGHITLEGCVQSFYERACAERALRFVDGVRAIENRITVKPVISASDIKLHIIEQLRAEVLDEAHAIEVHVQDGHVTISGTVHSSVERRTVEDSVRAAPGVQTVDNHLRVIG